MRKIDYHIAVTLDGYICHDDVSHIKMTQLTLIAHKAYPNGVVLNQYHVRF